MGITNNVRIELAREMLKRDYSAFHRYMFSLVDPATYKTNWHLDHICQQLQYAIKTPGHRCILNIPPRHGKSISTTVQLPAWAWTQDPTIKFLTISFSRSLATRDAVFSRQIIESDRYQDLFGHQVTLRRGDNGKQRYTNTAGGHRISTSIEGGATGEGADVLIIDDPYNALQAYSKAEQRKVMLWWRNAIQSRLNPDGMNVILLIMQRFTMNDIVADILGSEAGKEWNRLIFPMEYRADNPVSQSDLGLFDPRTEEGELLVKGGYPDGYIERLKLNPISWQGQYQQSPGDSADGLIDVSIFPRHSQPPIYLKNLSCFGDTSTGEGTDWTVFGIFGQDMAGGDTVYLIDMVRVKTGILGIKKAADEIIKKYPNLKRFGIEFTSNGQALYQMLQNDGLYCLYKITRTKGQDKNSRVMASFKNMHKLSIPVNYIGNMCIKEIAEFNEADTHSNDDMLDVALDGIDYYYPPQGQSIIGGISSLGLYF